jgi:hypothetical protein
MRPYITHPSAGGSNRQAASAINSPRKIPRKFAEIASTGERGGAESIDHLTPQQRGGFQEKTTRLSLRYGSNLSHVSTHPQH